MLRKHGSDSWGYQGVRVFAFCPGLVHPGTIVRGMGPYGRSARPVCQSGSVYKGGHPALLSIHSEGTGHTVACSLKQSLTPCRPV